MAGPLLALTSTLAGNLLILGSIANPIVADAAARRGIEIAWRRHARTVGLAVAAERDRLSARWRRALRPMLQNHRLRFIMLSKHFSIPPGSGSPATVLFGNGIWEIHRSTDGGASFERAAGEGLPVAGTVVELAADPLRPGRFLASVAQEGLWETLDAGDTWRRFGAGLPAETTLRLLFQPDDPRVVYAAADGLGAFRSADRGATWHPIGDGPAGAPTGRLSLGLNGDPLRLCAATDRGVWSIPAAPSTAPCVPGPATLCLQDGRFRVEVEWRDFEGGSGSGRSRPLTGDSGAFWFFGESNLELFVKVLDGRTVNGHWWVFYGSLSNVPFTLTVTDTETGTPRAYENPPRTFASRGDTTAF